MALWVILETFGGGLSMFLNGASVVRAQLPLCITFAAAAFPAKITLAHRFGVSGIIWGTVIPYAVVQILPYVHLTRRTFRGLAQRNNVPNSAARGGPAMNSCLRPRERREIEGTCTSTHSAPHILMRSAPTMIGIV